MFEANRFDDRIVDWNCNERVKVTRFQCRGSVACDAKRVNKDEMVIINRITFNLFYFKLFLETDCFSSATTNSKCITPQVFVIERL